MPVQIMQIRCTAAYNPLFLTSRRDVPADSEAVASLTLVPRYGFASRASRLYKVLWVAEKGVNGGWGLEPHVLTSSISLTRVLGKLL